MRHIWSGYTDNACEWFSCGFDLVLEFPKIQIWKVISLISNSSTLTTTKHSDPFTGTEFNPSYKAKCSTKSWLSNNPLRTSQNLLLSLPRSESQIRPYKDRSVRTNILTHTGQWPSTTAFEGLKHSPFNAAKMGELYSHLSFHSSFGTAGSQNQNPNCNQSYETHFNDFWESWLSSLIWMETGRMGEHEDKSPGPHSNPYVAITWLVRLHKPVLYLIPRLYFHCCHVIFKLGSKPLILFW